MKKRPNKATREKMREMAEWGCVVCRKEYKLQGIDIYSPANIHHFRSGVGMGQRSEQMIPLCIHHHQGKYGFHTNPKLFRKNYGTEEELFEYYENHKNDNLP